jgi:hypothetical protein
VRFCNELANWLSTVIPSGGETGQVLVKKSDSDFDLEWGDGLPDDGEPGQVLTLNDELEAEWAEGLPEGGEQYQVLQRDQNGVAVWDWVRAVDDE